MARLKFKPDYVEIKAIQTRRGKRYIHTPVKDPKPIPSPSRSASPSKKRAWSPGGLEHDNYDYPAADQMPKRSRTAGKVNMNLPIN